MIFDQIKQAGKDPSVIVVFTKPEQVNEVILNSYTTIYGDSCGKIILWRRVKYVIGLNLNE